MFINHQRRQILTGTLAGALAAFPSGNRVRAATEQPNCSGLPADVKGTHTWLALRFVHQGDANACMLAPILPGSKTTAIDNVLRYGIFCTGYKALNEYMYLGKGIKFQGAAAAVEQPEILFEDFKLENPEVDVPRLAKAEEDEHCRPYEEAGRPPEQVARQRTLWGFARQPRPRWPCWAFKFRGQTHGTAGFAIDSYRNEHLPNAIVTACLFRDLDEIRLWRLQQVSVDFLFEPPTPRPDEERESGWDLRYGCYFKKEELGGQPINSILKPKQDGTDD